MRNRMRYLSAWLGYPDLCFPREVGQSPLPNYLHRVQRLKGVALLETPSSIQKETNILHLLYASSETCLWDPVTHEESSLSASGAGFLAMHLPCPYPLGEILAGAGEATDGTFFHGIFPDGTHARELIVQDLKIKYVSEK